MQSPVLGIDLGTTNSVVAVADGRQARVLADGDGRRLVPSVVSFHPDGSILVGHEARERRLVDAANTIYSIKRLIGRPYTSVEVQRARERVAFALEETAVGGVQVRVRRGTFALPEISAMVLRHLRTMAENALGQPCTRAVITVPANFNELQRSATQAAGKVAGLEVLRILNEPTAATLAYGYGKDKPETIAVFDLGGGTFDLTVLDLEKDVFEVVSTAGDTFLGGDDIDVLVADKMALACLQQHRYDPKTDPQTYERLRAAGEWVKCQLSMVTDVEVTLEELLHDTHGRTIDFRFRMTRDELESLTRPLVARAFDVVADALRSAGRRPKEIGSVVLVGGSTRMPLVRRMVSEYFGKEPHADIDPDLVVAQGAAIHGYTLGGAKRNTQPLGKEVARVALKRAAPPKVDVKTRVPVPPRKQPAFAPEDPRDVAPAIDEPTRIAAAPTRDDRPARRVGSEPPARGTPAASVPKHVATQPPPRELSHPSFDLDDAEDSPTRIGPLPARPPLPEGPDLSVPFEVPSAVAVMRTQAVGVPSAPQPAAPLSPEAKRRKDSLLDLDPVEALPLKRTRDPSPQPAPIAPPRAEPARPPREPTMRIGTGRDPQPIAPPAEIAAPASRQAAPGTLALSSSDLRPMTGAARPAPPPVPPAAPPPDREQIQAALFGGRGKPFADVPSAPSLPVPEPGLRSDIFAFDPPSASTPISLDAPLAWDAPAGLPEPAQPAPPARPVPAPLALGAQPAPAAPAMAPRQPVVSMADRPAPLLMDVTPLALGLETAGGYCQHLVARNAPIPTEKTRVFSTARDDQSEVEVRICQGESNLFKDNQALGAIQLSQLRKARRGQVRIEVTFMIDASGILDVKATDLDTKQQQALRISLRGGIADGEVDAMRARQAELFAAQR
jgi:molecular chaperone DnaK